VPYRKTSCAVSSKEKETISISNFDQSVAKSYPEEVPTVSDSKIHEREAIEISNAERNEG